jgi:hypothetical protein
MLSERRKEKAYMLPKKRSKLIKNVLRNLEASLPCLPLFGKIKEKSKINKERK